MKHNWEYKPFKQLANILYGCPFESDYFNSESKGMPLIRIRDVKPGFTSTFFDGDYSDEYIIKKGEYLIGMDGEFNIAPWKSENALLNQRVCRVKSSNEEILSTDFIFYFLGQELKRIEEKTPFVTVKHLSAKVLNSISTPVPHKKIQEQIVAELDKINEVMEDCRELLRNLDALAQSLFNETFSSIEETVPLSFYVKALVGGKSLASKEVSPNKVLKSGAVTYDYFDKNSTKYLPVDYIPDSEHSVSTGDLIISRMNTAELVGACAYVFDVDDNVYLPDRLWRIEYKSNANPIYLWKSLISESAKWQIRSKASGTSGSMKNISKPLLLSININKVPISIQQQFAERIEAIEAEKKHVEATIAELQTLLASRMDYWFN